MYISNRNRLQWKTQPIKDEIQIRHNRLIVDLTKYSYMNRWTTAVSTIDRLYHCLLLTCLKIDKMH